MIVFTKTHKIIQSSEGNVALLKQTDHGYEPIFMIEDPLSRLSPAKTRQSSTQ